MNKYIITTLLFFIIGIFTYSNYKENQLNTRFNDLQRTELIKEARRFNMCQSQLVDERKMLTRLLLNDSNTIYHYSILEKQTNSIYKFKYKGLQIADILFCGEKTNDEVVLIKTISLINIATYSECPAYLTYTDDSIIYIFDAKRLLEEVRQSNKMMNDYQVFRLSSYDYLYIKIKN